MRKRFVQLLFISEAARGLDPSELMRMGQVSPGQDRPRVSAALSRNAPSEAEPRGSEAQPR